MIRALCLIALLSLTSSATSAPGQVNLLIETEGSEQWLTLRTPDGSFTWIKITPMVRNYIDKNLLPRKECL